MTSKFTELAIDCADPGGLARFWCSVLDYEVQDEEDGIVTIGSPMVPEGKNHPGPVPPALTFARVPEALAGRGKRGPRGEPQARAMLKGAIRCPDCEGAPMNKLTCRASSKHGSGTYTYYRCTGTGSRRKGCGWRWRTRP